MTAKLKENFFTMDGWSEDYAGVSKDVNDAPNKLHDVLR
jgi:hypothetical protein